MNKTEIMIRQHMQAAAALLQQSLADAKEEDPAGLAGLLQAIKAGGLLTLHSTFAQAVGMARLVIEVTEPNGTTHQLLECDLNRDTKP